MKVVSHVCREAAVDASHCRKTNHFLVTSVVLSNKIVETQDLTLIPWAQQD